jgi:hypothetical protein
MALSEDQIGNLLEWFISSSVNYREYNPLREKALEENNKWIQPSVIAELPDEELEKRFLDYYNNNAGHKQNLIKLNRDRIIKDKAIFRNTVKFLFDEEVNLKERVNEVLQGKYRINGFGRGILTALLMDFNPDRYCQWNRKTEMGFQVLGWKIRERGDSPGVEYEKVLDALQKLRQMRPDLNLTLNDVDFFLHTISAEEEGKKEVRRIAGIRIPGLNDIIYEILKKQPQNWALSRDFFHDFYRDHILGDKNGWSRETIGRVIQKLLDYEKRPGVNLTEALLEDLSGDSEGIGILRDLIDLVKVCDRHAYQQDRVRPIVARTFVRQNVYYDKILRWKLEDRRETMHQDIVESQNLPSIFKNVFLFLQEPQNYIPMVSPIHRRWFIQNFMDDSYDFDDNDSQKACIESDELIKKYFEKELASEPQLLEKLKSASLEDHFFTRVMMRVMYHENVRPLWDKERLKDKFLLFSFKEDSTWDDRLGESYQYGSTVPNHTRVKPGASFVLHKKNVGFIGHGVVGEIAPEYSEEDGPQIKRAYYESFEPLDPPRELDPEINEKIRSAKGYNVQHAIKVINKEIFDKILEPPDRQVAYWQIAPGEGARLWEDLLDSSVAAVGWDVLDIDLRGRSKDDLLSLYRKHYPDAGDMEAKINRTYLWNFLNLKPGDKIVANKGKSLLLGLGVVKGPYEYRPDREEYKHTIGVDYYRVTDGIPIPEDLMGKFGKTIIPLSKDEFEALEALFPPKGKSSWIFQANPKHYDIDGAIKSLDLIPWEIRQHKDKIEKGDSVYIWRSGKEAGVIAVAEILSDPKEMPLDEREASYINSPDEFSPRALRAPVRIRQVLENTILKEELTNHQVLSDLTILKSWQQTNYSLTPKQAEALEALVSTKPAPTNPEYPLSDCAEETGFSEELLERWVRAIERKGQVILYGPPGTGKTYIAERLAKHLIGGGDGFSEIVQFHPAYAYEDFVQGIRPQARDDGGLDYPVVPGRFLEFCEKSQAKKDRCVLIIDEINRANLARVFGELMYLLEYRNREVPLASGGSFQIPANVRMIGTMNTADRSIALVDHALRRRFAFLPLYPEYEILRSYHKDTGFPVENLIKTLERMNNQIGDQHYEVGITFFLREDLGEQIEDIWQMEIEPYLEEYFFDQREKVDEFRWKNIQDKILP